MSAHENTAINNAEEVIERFGGIRPMAKKIEVAVTTIQGWKKRNTIPGGRRAQILKAAKTHNVDLSDLIQEKIIAPRNDNGSDEKEPEDIKTAPSTKKDETPTGNGTDSEETQDNACNTPPIELEIRAPVPSELLEKNSHRPDSATLDQKLAETEKKAVTKSTWINLLLLFLTLGAIVTLLWPQGNKMRLNTLEENVGQIQNDVSAVKEKQSFLGTLIPDNLDEKIAHLQSQADELKEQARIAREGLGSALQRAQIISEEVLTENGGNLGQRVEHLQSRMSEITVTPQVAALLERFSKWQQDENGQNIMGRSVSEVSSLINNLNGDMSLFNTTLDSARAQNTALGQSFENVPAEDLKAAALLLGMSQFRASMNRDNQPFEADLQLLMNLVGKDNTELRTALERLAPQAKTGVLTPSGLTGEFKTIAGDIVVASLKGENVSFRDKATARMNELFQIEKDGKLLTGTPTQATVAKTDKLLEEGDLAGAIEQMKTLQGEEAALAEPWINKAQATLMAQHAKNLVTKTLNNISGITAGGASGASQLIQNKESGINILVPQKNPIDKIKGNFQ